MNIKCLFGIHDWMIIENITKAQLKSDLIHEERYKNEPVMPPNHRIICYDLKNTQIINKVCLICGKKIDNLSRAKKIIIKEIEKENLRKSKAFELFNKG